MIRIIQYLLFCSILLYTTYGNSQNTDTVELHIQVYDQGICIPMLESNYYKTSCYQRTKSVLQSGDYYSTINAYVNSPDSADLRPQSNHQLQSSSLQFNPTLDYELVFLRYNGFDRSSPDSMVIKISQLDKSAQLTLLFKKGKFTLEKMKLFRKLKPNASPDFKASKSYKTTLRIDSTAHFTNGKTKARYFVVHPNFPLYYVQEFDSINPSCFAQGFRLISNYNGPKVPTYQSTWGNTENTKYGYWEYFEHGNRVKHELWASRLQQKFEWFPSGQLKFAMQFNGSNNNMSYIHYLKNGDIKEEYQTKTTTRSSFIKSYTYSPQRKVILINTYNSTNGITKQGLQKRALFYPSGKLKMVENYIGTYSIKYYNEDGTEKNN